MVREEGVHGDIFHYGGDSMEGILTLWSVRPVVMECAQR
jgi:hypothetical protein